ncbi:MAG: type IV toxin-antitoxin system AbiEi family antitoxin domain-containing protein [Actinomycetia bacterium]|nr:type IV toxin-antitoxin system AbiEi family antitoxin domain-containing protein [Actinomycetes bacterium]
MDPSHELPREVAQWLARRGGGASRAQLLGKGLTSVDLARHARHGLLVRVRRGHYSPAAPRLEDRWDQARQVHLYAVASLAGTDQVAALRTAALVWGLPVCSIPAKPEFIRPPGRSRPSGTRVRFGHLADDDVVRHEGIWVTSLVRSAVDIALDLPVPESLITLDAALHRGVRRDELRDHLASRGSVRHLRRASVAIEWADPHVESPLESRCRGELLIDDIPRPQCNLPLRLGDREIRPDLLWLALGIAAEVDGKGKYDEPDVLWQEKLRQEWMETDLGLIVLRFTYAEIVGDPLGCARRWRKARARRAAAPWVRPRDLEVRVRDSR